MGVGRGYCGAGPCGEGRPLRHHDTMASLIRCGYWTKGQPGRGQHASLSMSRRSTLAELVPQF